jgi:hypothetical protein
LATKFYCETTDIFVNADIARLLWTSGKLQPEKLNRMETALAQLIDYDLFVSPNEYNTESSKINQQIRRIQEDLHRN